MFIIDFDDTLFETEKYKQARMMALRDFGVSEQEFWATYQEARNDESGLFAYSDERHTVMLARRGYDDEKVANLLHQATRDAVNFLDREAPAFLIDLKTYQQPLVLLSLGDPATQEEKIKAVDLANDFDCLFLFVEIK